MLSVIQLSERRYAVANTSDTGEANLNIYSQGRLGAPHEMIRVPKSQLLTKPLDHGAAMLLFCLLSKQAFLEESEWDLILPKAQSDVEQLLRSNEHDRNSA